MRLLLLFEAAARRWRPIRANWPWGTGRGWCWGAGAGLLHIAGHSHLVASGSAGAGAGLPLLPRGGPRPRARGLGHYRSALLQAVSTVRPTSCCCRWIVWSLASRERRQGLPALAPAAVMDRLKLRWKVTCDNMCSVVPPILIRSIEQ